MSQVVGRVCPILWIRCSYMASVSAPKQVERDTHGDGLTLKILFPHRLDEDHTIGNDQIPANKGYFSFVCSHAHIS